MSLTRLKNIITSRTGRMIYVNPDDFDASDSIDNRGNSALRPFKTIQRAFLEVAKFSYRVGLSNDEFDAFSIMLYPAEYIIDNRPGEILYTNVPPIDANSNLDLNSPNNVLYKFNSVEGGVIVPRGCSLVGTDLRRTKIIPKYVPYPTVYPEEGILQDETDANNDGIYEDLGDLPPRTSIFRVTGGTYFWQFSFFDGAEEGVYFKPGSTKTIPPKFSHHRLTCFEFADGLNPLSALLSQGRVPAGDYTAVPNIDQRTDLEIYYQKVSKAFTAIPDTSGDPAQDQIQARVEENRIVGPISDEYKVQQIQKNGTTATAFTVSNDGSETPVDHGFSVGVNINVSGVTGSTGPNSAVDRGLYNGSFVVTSASGNRFTYQMSAEPSGNAQGTNITVKTEIDTVDSASPYAFNLSLRSVWGMNGMLADGSKATGFKSMVVAQFTGLSLQKDDRAFVRFVPSATGGDYVPATAGDGAHLDGFAEYRRGWGHDHIKCSNDSFIQAVSVFAVGYAGHFVSLSGGDMSITNSNSNFGNTALRSAGFKAQAFSKDKAGEISHIIPPKALATISTTATGSSGAQTLNLPSGVALGIIPGMRVTSLLTSGGTKVIPDNTTVTLVNAVDNIVTISQPLTAAMPAGTSVIFGEETSVNWVNIDIQKTKYINENALATGGNEGTRLYLYGYNNEATPPPTRVQGFTIGARVDGTGNNAVPDKLFCLLAPTAGADLATLSAKIDGAGPSVSGLAAGAPGSPIQFDSNYYDLDNNSATGTSGDTSSGATVTGKETQGGWYLACNVASSFSTENTIYNAIKTNTALSSLNFTPTTFIKRIADSRNLQDRTYRIRLVIPKEKTSPIPRNPLSGYVMQPLSGAGENNNLTNTFYIYDINVVQEYIRDSQDGIFYITLLYATVRPSVNNFRDRKFSQNVNEVYPTFDRDNPVADPAAAVSVADNETIGLVSATDGATPPNKDPKLSITKEAILKLVTDGGWNTPAWDAQNNTLSGTLLTARAGDEETRKIAIRQNNDGTVNPIPVEFRRHSILRSGNHTFEYLGFGPGNYSTAFPQTQVETLSADQIKFSQSIKEEAGVAFYSGLNSNGDLFIGNQVINPVTGQITNEDIAQLNVVGEENTTIETFSELVLTDKLTVIGGASNQLESIFAGPVTFQAQLSSTNNIVARKLTYANSDGTVQRQTLLAPELVAGNPSQGPNLANISGYDTPGDGDIVYNENWTPGKSLGWIYFNAAWKEFGLTDTDFINIDPNNGTPGIGIGTAANAGTYRVAVDGNVYIDGDVVGTGLGVVGPSKYITRTYVPGGSGGPDGSVTTFAVTNYSAQNTSHTSSSVLVFLNGVAQIGGSTAQTAAGTANYHVASHAVTFADPPLSTDTVHIIELPL